MTRITSYVVFRKTYSNFHSGGATSRVLKKRTLSALNAYLGSVSDSFARKYNTYFLTTGPIMGQHQRSSSLSTRKMGSTALLPPTTQRGSSDSSLCG